MKQQYTYSIDSGVSKNGISKTEKIHLTIALLVLTLAFTISFSGGLTGVELENFLRTFSLSFVAVGTAFLFHELAHRMVARKYGCWAEFRMWPMGLMMALFFSFMGFVFAAPGAVMISGQITEEQNGYISASGPATNWLVGTLFLAGSYVLLINGHYLWVPLAFVCFINLFIGGFNLLPFGPLDGAKIFRWSVPNYILLVTAIVGTLIVGRFLGPLSIFI